MPLRHHLFDLILEQEKQGFYVHSEDAVKGFLGLICERPVFTGDPGIVKCVVEPSEGFDSEWYDPPHLLGLAEVCLDERRRSAVAFDVIDELSPLALPPCCDDYLRTQLSHTPCSRSANATVSTGDECHLSSKFQFISHSLALQSSHLPGIPFGAKVLQEATAPNIGCTLPPR